MELEKIATNAVETSIVKTDRLTSFISRGDKEPCWDGNIYIHESKNHNKRNIKKVSTQIKGKAVTPDQVGNTIKYRISHDDLTAYMMNGGTMFFVVYINKETGEPLQIYYTQLLPIKIKEILKKDLKSYDVWFNKFPENNSEKTAIFVQFHSDAQRQASFAGMELPSIDDLTKRGVLESLTFQCTGYGDYRALSSVPRIMDGKPLSIYANIKGYSCPVPVKYIESIHQVTMSAHESSPITVNGIQYYDGFQKVTTAEKMELHIGSCVRVTCPNSVDENHSAPITLNLKICGMLKQRIIGIEFIIAMLTCKKFCIGEYELPVEIPDTERKVIEDSNLSETLASYKRVQALLECMNVNKDFDIQECTDSELGKLNMLVATICDKRPVKEAPPTTDSVQEIKIGNLLLAVVYIKNPRGGYIVLDYFGNHIDVLATHDDCEPVPVSQFISMRSDDFLRFDNLNLNTIIEDYKRIKVDERHIGYAINTMLCMLRAYDKKPSPDLLDAAHQISDWIREFPELIAKEIATLNHLQIVLRERPLSYKEKSEIYAILAESEDKFIRLGGFILLDEQLEAKAIMDALDDEEAERFKEFPIYKFYRDPEGESYDG